MKTLRTESVLLAAAVLLALSLPAATQDFEFLFVDYVDNPDGWDTSSSSVPSGAVPSQTLTGDEGARVLQEKGLPNLLRTYNDLRNDGTFRRAALQVIGVDNETVTVVLINDKNGMSEAMMVAYDVCDYSEGGTLYSWPCANDVPTRQIRVGEHNAAQQSSGGGWSSWQGVILHELVHTQDRTQWTPAVGMTRPLIGDEARRAYGADRTHYYIEILPNTRAAFMEGAANFVGWCWDNNMRSRYMEAISNDDHFVVEFNSDTHNLMKESIGDEETTFTFERDGTDYRYAAYSWNRLTLPVLIRNEVFIGLLLYNMAVHLPPDGNRLGFERVYDEFGNTNIADRNVMDVVGSLLADADFEDQVLGGNLRKFVIAALDIMSNFSASREDFEQLLGPTNFLPEAVLQSVLDEYFEPVSQSGIMNREDVRANMGSLLPDYAAAMQALGERYNMASYPLFR